MGRANAANVKTGGRYVFCLLLLSTSEMKSLMRSLGTVTERWYCSISHPDFVLCRTPDPRHVPIHVVKSAENHTYSLSFEKWMSRSCGVKSHALPLSKYGFANAMNSVLVHRSVSSVPI